MFVETEFQRQIRSAILSGESPILIAGLPGSGKTTLLEWLADYWRENKGPAFFIRLNSVHGEVDLLDEFRRQLDENYEIVEPLIVESSSGRVAKSVVSLLSHGSHQKLILLDGLDESTNPEVVGRVILAIVERTEAVVVLSSRPNIADNTLSYIPFRRFEIPDLTSKEVHTFLSEVNVPVESHNLARLYRTIGGNPLRATLLSSFLNEDPELQLEIANPEQENILRHLTSRILIREASRQNISYSQVLAVHARLAICGSAGAKVITQEGRELQILSASPLVGISQDSFSLAHPELGPIIVELAGLIPFECRISDLDFGAEEAERDQTLTKNFVALPGADDLWNGKKNIVVGDRGAGKSALFASMANVAIDNAQVIKLADPAELMLRLATNGQQLQTAEHFRAAWLLSIACCLATSLQTSSSAQKGRAMLLQAAAPDGTLPLTPGGRILSSLRFFTGKLAFKFGPVVLESAIGGGRFKFGARPLDIEVFLVETVFALRSSAKRVLIALDRVDEVFKYDRALQERLVQGLFLAESTLSKWAEIQLVVFIRSDLFETCDIQEKNKLVSRTLNMRWSRDALLEMAMRRVFANSCFDPISTVVGSPPTQFLGVALRYLFPNYIEGRPFVEWLWKNLENGNGVVSPRQLVLFLILVRQAAESVEFRFESTPVFREDLLKIAMTRLSELSFGEAINDFKVGKTLLRNCRAAKMEVFSLSEIGNFVELAEGSIGLQVDQLERLGVLERIVTREQDGTRVPKFRIPLLYTRCWGGEQS